MSFWDKIQKDMKKNIHEGLEIVKEGSTIVSQKIEKLTEEGKNKYKVFSLNMKVQDEFAKLGGQIYDLTTKKSKNPMTNKKVVSTIKKINKLESQITKLEMTKTKKKAAKKSPQKARKKRVSKRPVKRTQ
jgi:hypothetical protein